MDARFLRSATEIIISFLKRPASHNNTKSLSEWHVTLKGCSKTDVEACADCKLARAQRQTQIWLLTSVQPSILALELLLNYFSIIPHDCNCQPFEQSIVLT